MKVENVDFDVEKMKKNTTIIVRRLLGTTIDECARLCLTEESFDCQVMTYSPFDNECKWTSLLFFDKELNSQTMFLTENPGFSLFTSKIYHTVKNLVYLVLYEC